MHIKVKPTKRTLNTVRIKKCNFFISLLGDRCELPYYLLQSGRKDELSNILFDFNWLQTKLEAIDFNSLIRDYDYLPDVHNTSFLQNTIQMSTHVLSRDKTQLLGRLQSFKDMDLILEQARTYKELWLGGRYG